MSCLYAIKGKKAFEGGAPPWRGTPSVALDTFSVYTRYRGKGTCGTGEKVFEGEVLLSSSWILVVLYELTWEKYLKGMVPTHDGGTPPSVGLDTNRVHTRYRGRHLRYRGEGTWYRVEGIALTRGKLIGGRPVLRL